MSKLIGSAIMETVLGKDSRTLNGEFKLPEYRVEAMYAPEMIGDRQN